MLSQRGDYFSLAGAITELSENLIYAKDLGRKVREKALRRNDPEAIGRKAVEIYKKVLKLLVINTEMTLRNFLEKLDRKVVGYRIRLYEFFCTKMTYALCYIKGIEIGNKCVFNGIPMLRKHENSKIKIGNYCRFRSDKISNLVGVNRKCTVATLRENAEIVIGDNCGFSGTVIGAAHRIIIENLLLAGANTTITDTNWHHIEPEFRHGGKTSPAKPVFIGKNVWLGLNSIVLQGVTIGDDSLIGANSVVTKNIPPKVIAAGNPCNPIKII